jgi:hypothetical protein
MRPFLLETQSEARATANGLLHLHVTFILGSCILLRSLLGLYYSGRQSQQSFFIIISFHPLTHYMFQRKYSPEDGPHEPKHVVSEWKEILIKNFVATDGHYNKVCMLL